LFVLEQKLLVVKLMLAYREALKRHANITVVSTRLFD
jgi:hypothetical protein